MLAFFYGEGVNNKRMKKNQLQWVIMLGWRWRGSITLELLSPDVKAGHVFNATTFLGYILFV